MKKLIPLIVSILVLGILFPTENTYATTKMESIFTVSLVPDPSGTPNHYIVSVTTSPTTFFNGIDVLSSTGDFLFEIFTPGILTEFTSPPIEILPEQFPIRIVAGGGIIEPNFDEEFNIPTFVGGEYFTLDTTALLISGLQTNLTWIIPVLAAAGIGAVLVRKKF